jgi:predicted transposase YbfD/YdcC
MKKNSERSAKSPARLSSLAEALAKVRDQRAARGIRYELLPLLIILMLAKLADADTPLAIADWAAERAAWLRKHLQLDWPRMPHHSTFRRLLQKSLSLPDLRQQAQAFLAARQSSAQRLYNLDGKTLRGTIAGGTSKGEHLLALQQADTNLVLAQAPVGEKNSEISAAPALLKAVALTDKIVSGDAMHTQRNLSRQVVRAGGDYLWFVKQNQPTLCQRLQSAFATSAAAPADACTVTQYDKGHGRMEQRELTVSAQVTNMLSWPYAAQAFKLQRTRTECRSGKVTQQTVYGITSLAPLTTPPADLLAWTRKHWSIENGLHYRRDVTFREDRCRMKSGRAAECLAIFNNLAIGLLRWLGWDNLAKARRHYDAHWLQALHIIQGFST